MRFALFATCAMLLASCDSSFPLSGHECTLLGCENGVRVEFSFRQAGTYIFEVVIDGQKTTCTASLPLARQPPEPCDGGDMFLSLIGSMSPKEQQSIGGLFLTTTTASSISIRATRDGTLVGEKTLAPPPYDVRPGPNGPDCEPKECKFARSAFP